MLRQWETQPICQHMEGKGARATRCTNLATYLILYPPLASTPTPTPVYLDHENPMSRSVQQRGYPTHCRAHAYQMCGLVVAGGGPPPLVAGG